MKGIRTLFSIAALAVVFATAAVCIAAVSDEKTGTSVDVGRGGVHVDTGKPKGGTTVNVGKGGVHVVAGKGKPQGGTTVGVGRKGVGVSSSGGTRVNVGKGGVNVNTGPKKKKPVVVNVGGKGKGKSPFDYVYAASTQQLHDPKLALFFLEKDLRTGNKMNLFFSKAITASTVGDGEADRLALDEKNLPEILNEFSLEPESEEAQAIKETIETCNGPANKGEEKFCATSQDSMVGFARTRLGANVQALRTTVEKETSNQEYTVAAGVHEMKNRKSVACHQQTFVYPVYYCHETAATSAYVVPLVGKDGSEVKAVAVCHKDTSSWNPKHLAFQLLKVKPGAVPVCHFLPQDHVVWVQN
ncbi:hypothetical protein ACLOJK_040291 [Asimina triloba]